MTVMFKKKKNSYVPNDKELWVPKNVIEQVTNYK